MGPQFNHLLDSLGWAVLHSLWQGTLVLALIFAWRQIVVRRSPALSHAGSVVGLLACLGAFLWTFAAYLTVPGAESAAASGLAAATEGESALRGFMPSFEGTVAPGFDPSAITPWLATAWAMGFAFMSLRYAFAFGQAQQLRTLGVGPVPREWQQRFSHLLRQTGVSSRVELMISLNISDPVTLGLFKPVVLVPVGFLTGLPADQVEAVLRHELAHIRRYDYAVNLIQTGIRTVLFFHPAVHIMSGWADRDREEACDDLAVRDGRDPLDLVRGLAALRVNPPRPSALAMAARGNGAETPLMLRLSRLSGRTNAGLRGRPGSLLMSVIGAFAIGGVYLGATARADAHPHPVPPIAPPVELSDTFVLPIAPTLDLSETIVAPAIPPVPPTPPVLSRLETLQPRTEADWERVFRSEQKAVDAYTRDIQRYSTEMRKYAKATDADPESYEDFADTLEDMYDDMSDLFDDRRDEIADRFEDFVEARVEAEMEAHEASLEAQIENEIEAQAEALAESAERVAEETVRAVELSLKSAFKASSQSDKRDRKARHKAAYAKANAHNSARHQAFRDTVMAELLEDGLIRNPHETVRLSHPDNVMSLNGSPMPARYRDKYCGLMDAHGFTDNRSIITIAPDNFEILTDWKNGRHRTKVTYGTTRH